MTAVPSIKGSVFSNIVEDVRKLVESREIQATELSRWLTPEDIALLDAELLVSNWYPVAAYDRLNRLLLEVVGRGRNEYLRERGRETARKLVGAGLYAQLEYLHRTEVSQTTGAQPRFEAFGRDLRKLASLSASILNFSKWTVIPDPEHERRQQIEVTEARDFPESLCWRSDGFINEMASQHGDGNLWGWTRPRADLILFQMQHDLS